MSLLFVCDCHPPALFNILGDNLGSWIVSQRSLMVEQRSNPSLAWLAPSDRFWKEDEVRDFFFNK